MQSSNPPSSNLLTAHQGPRQQLTDYLFKLVTNPSTSSDQIGNICRDFISQIPSESTPSSQALLRYALVQTIILLFRPGPADPSTETSSISAGLLVIDVSLYLGEHSHVDRETTGEVLRCLFSLRTLAQLRGSSSDILQRLVHYGRFRTRKPDMLRTTNSLMQRDKAGWDPILQGKLTLLLAASLPVWHPSGMKRRGGYNDQIELDYNTPAKDSTPSNFDMDLYEQFWSLQNQVRDPQLAENPDRWAVVSMALHKVLEAFETLDCIPNQQQHQQDAGPAYLISPSILRLQMVDPKFRRRVLLQYAIFLDHGDALASTPIQGNESPDFLKKVKFCRTVFNAGGEGAKLKARVRAQLERDSAGKFRRFARLQMQRDRVWSQWKRTGYKNLTRDGVQPPKAFKRRAILAPVPEKQGGLQASKKRRTESDERDSFLGNERPWRDLTTKERMAPLVEPDRSPVPTLEKMESQLREDIEDEDITHDMKRKNDTKFVWRSLRVLCDQSVSTLLKVIDLKAKGGIDLERCLPTADVKQAQDVDPNK
eukprot:GFKZ01015715.1.p1 GENE.GFKZ01015715.1~~GFKZ01015715.1.p1  ORF type:complete len:538 (+),score=66.99 GFKZ01015715.1:231-1844(+)